MLTSPAKIQALYAKTQALKAGNTPNVANSTNANIPKTAIQTQNEKKLYNIIIGICVLFLVVAVILFSRR